MFRPTVLVMLAVLLPLTAAAAGVAAAASDERLPDFDTADPILKAALDRRALTLQLPGFSHHFQQPRYTNGAPAGFQWNEKNWGIGLQSERHPGASWDGWVDKTSVGTMRDSLYAWGLYAGRTWQKRWRRSEALTVDAGGGAFIFYRRLAYKADHRLVPAVLPVLSIKDRDSGLGANAILVPRVKTGHGEMPAVAFVQFTREF